MYSRLIIENMKKNIQPILSVLTLLYFSTLVFLSYKNIKLNNFLDAIFELITIPFILLTIVLLVINFKKWSLEKWSLGTKSFLSILFLISSITLMVFATIYDI
ncbi:hypothetical protein FLJC2902T_32440 [Flavobacterium limnosediminis JC2902]|uniref:Uncharacterized protein n=2 Tax=Flavobacterium TaxID=237 RepID=V6SEH7_9FLAO|nr:hypothetical protein FLJC2902T_32440 [Flavobacterium limnosediminis JC2902]